jgi:hypothetical protein
VAPRVTAKKRARPGRSADGLRPREVPRAQREALAGVTVRAPNHGAAGDPALAALLASLVTDRVVYFPIRHHSPACASHLERLLRERKPDCVLIEGPAGFTPLIPLLLHPDAKTPFAIYTSFVPEAAAEMEPAPLGQALPPLRRAAYYPFCDCSPELVALRVAAELGARTRFIDLDFPQQVRVEQAATQAVGSPRVESLLTERHLAHSRYLQALAQRAGCRDHNDLWDHWFETRVASGDWPAFLREVAAWCHFARADASAESLRADGTLAREAAMAGAIRRELARGAKSVVVVTGGFHTVALPALVNASWAPAVPKFGPPTEAIGCLVRYGFEQLHALNGYSAGMPSPAYYDALWRAVKAGAAEPFSGLAAQWLVDLGRLTRTKKFAGALSLADEIAALEQACRLAQLRGHLGPTREDLLDGIRSCFVKGAIDAEGELILGLARHLLGGTRLGEVPAAAGAPPLVQDFRARAERLRLNVGDTVRRKPVLDLYRKAAQRETSRFFHSLALLDVPFALLTAGPDFVRGTGLERLHEHWEYQWAPATESRLVEAGIFGATVEEAAANRLLQAAGELARVGKGRSAGEAVALLLQACRAGLHRHTGRLLALIAAEVGDDPNLNSLTHALGQLVLLRESREPLEAHRLPEIPRLARAALERACYQLRQLGETPEAGANDILGGVLRLGELMGTGLFAGDAFDTSLFWEPLAKTAETGSGPPLLLGGIHGLLHAHGRLDTHALLSRLEGSLNAAGEAAAGSVQFLTGLLRTHREMAWREPALAAAVDRLLAGWSDDEFIARLPHLRLAFADLAPRETDLVADVVAKLIGGQGRECLVASSRHSEAEMLAALRLDGAVKQALDDDGLGDWLEVLA